MVAGAWQAMGALLPWIAAVGFFAAQGASGDFIHGALFENLGWKREVGVGKVLGLITHYNPWFFALAAGGAVALALDRRREFPQAVARVFLLSHAAVPFAGLFLTPVPFPQYCLIFIPLFAILGGHFLAVLVDGTAPLTATLAVTALAVIGLISAAPMVVHPLVYPAFVAAAIIAVATVRVHRRPALALAVVIAMLCAYPAQWTRWMLGEGDQGQFAELKYVLATPRDTVVMDGWTGYGVFRPHLWYYWMLHPGVRSMLPERAVNDFVASLESGRLRPNIVLFDAQLREVSPELTRFVEQHFSPTGVGVIHVPRRDR
jgi:hypothetical protein